MTNFIILTLLGSSRDLFLYIGVAGVMLIETIFLNDPVMQHTLLSCASKKFLSLYGLSIDNKIT